MQRDNIIILKKGDIYETWGSLTEITDVHPELSYSYLKSKKYPFKSKGYEFIKVPYRQLNKLML